MYSLGIVTQAFLGIILTLDTWVYSLISSAYKIFMAIASARILSSDAYTAIANKVYVIIGVGMLFVLAYAIMKAIIDPDQMSKGDMAGGKILKSIAVAVIGLIVTPLLFDLAYMAQGKMLEDDILGKLFFRTGESTVESLTGGEPVNYDEELQNTGGAVAAVSVWRAFFYPVDGEDPDKIIADPEIARLNATVSAVGCAALAIGTAVAAYFSAGLALVVGGGAVASCITAVQKDEAADKIEEAAKDGEVSLSEAYVMVASGESFAIFQAFLDPVDEGQIRYTWFISTVCGAFVAYAFVSYAIDMGLRAAKLAYYQIIAPVPLILGVLPKNGDTVGKFAKGVLSTFMEVFVRISVVYIVVYIIAHLNELFSTVGALWDNENLTNIESLIAMALLIIGLVLFAKEAPKIIGETFGLKGDSGLKGLNIMDKLRRGEVFTAGTVVGSAGLAAVQGFRSNFNKKQTKNALGQTRDRGFGSRVVGGIGTAIGGAVSGGVRSGVGRARSGKAVGGFREAGDHIIRTSDDVSTRRDRRQAEWDEHSNPDKGGVVDYVTYKVGNWASKIDTLTDPDAKDVRMDSTIKAFGSTVDQQDAYRTKTGKVETTRYADRVVDAIKEEGAPKEYYEDAYRAALNAAAQSVTRIAGETDAAYQARVNAATAAVNREDFRNADYATEMAAYQRRTNAANKAREAMQDLDYIGLLGEKDAATVAHFRKYFSDNIAEIRAHQNDILRDKNGNVVVVRDSHGNAVGSTYGDLLRVNYGLNLDTGEVDIDAIKNAGRQLVIEVDDGRGGTREITYAAAYRNGKQVFTDSAGNVVDYQTVMARATSEDVTKVEAKTVINTVTDTTKAARNQILGSPEYNRAKARQRQQQENKNKSGNK